MELLDKAKQLLMNGNYTFVAIDDKEVYTSSLHGIAPIMAKVKEESLYFKGYYVADKVIGKSAAMLLIRSQIAGLYAEVLSEHAKKILDEYNIPYFYHSLVPYIINRTKDGMCPMENAVLEINDLEMGYLALQDTLEKLKRQK